MSTWKVILATLVIFCTGFFVGVLFPRAVRGDIQSKLTAPPPQPSERRLEALRRLTQDLALTAEQKARIENHIEESQERTRLIWELMGPEVQDEFRRLRAEVAQELTTEQRRQFEEKSRRNRRAAKADTNNPAVFSDRARP